MSPAPLPPALRLTEYLCLSGHVLARVKEGITYLGPPERRCRRCGQIAVVPQYCEWADMTDAQRQMTVRRAVLGTIFVGSGVGVALLVLVVLASLLARLPEPEVLVLAGIAFLLGPTAVAGLHVSRVRSSLARTGALGDSPHPGGG